MIPALLVGSNAGWRDQIDPVLAEHGIAVQWWWPTKAKLGPVPSGCGVVIVTTDNCSHTLSKPAMVRAREANVPLVCGTHRKAQMHTLLEKQGFPRLSPAAPDAPAAFIVPNPVPVLSLESPMSEPLLPPKFALPVPPPTLTPQGRILWPRLLPIVAARPWITTAEVSAIVASPASTLFRALRPLRETLGIRSGVGGGASQIVDRTRYEEVCAALGISPVTEDAGPTRPPGSAAQREGGDRRAFARRPVLPAPAAAPVAPSPAPATDAALSTTVEAIKLLVEAMRAEGVEEVTVKGSEITILRRVTVLTTLTV